MTPLQAARDRRVIEILLDVGVDPNCLEPEHLATLLGYKVDEPPECSLEEYRKYRSRAFGRVNPERVHNPFWTAMVRSGGAAISSRDEIFAQTRALSKSKTSTSAEKSKRTWNDPRVKPKTEMDF